MDLIEDKIIEYAENISKPHDEVLYQLYRETHLTAMNPIMLTGFLQGQLLSHISYMIQPTNILEIGSYTGYSAICLAKGIINNGHLHTIEIDEELEDICKKYFRLADMENTISLHIGDATQVIPKIDLVFDLAYIDGDKNQYLTWYHLILPKIQKGGYILADNVLWHGKVLNHKQNSDPETLAIKEFNEFIKNDERVANFLLPFRDGLMLIKKL